jgi:hypothetical protein
MGSFFYGAAEHVMETCPNCKVQHSIPMHLYTAAQQAAPNISIYCPNGHKWHYKSEAQVREEDLIRQERDRLKQRLAEKDDDIKLARDQRDHQEKRAIALKGHVTRIKNRVAAGVCPCCNRTFGNLAAHMATKHKDYKKEKVA